MEISFFITYLLGLSYIALLVFPLLGSVGFPFSDELFLLAVGYMVSTGFINYSMAIFLCLIGTMMGENIAFFIGSNGGKYFNFLVSERRLRKVEKWCESYGAKAIFFSKIIPGLRFFVPFVAGASNIRYSTFFIYNALGSSIIITLFVTLGYFFGESIPYVTTIINNLHIFALLFALIIIIIAAILICFFRQTIRHKIRESNFLDVWLQRDEIPYQMVTFGNPSSTAKRIMAKTRKFDGKINIIIGDIQKGSLKRMTKLKKWVSLKTYKKVIQKFSKLAKPKIEEWE